MIDQRCRDFVDAIFGWFSVKECFSNILVLSEDINKPLKNPTS